MKYISSNTQAMHYNKKGSILLYVLFLSSFLVLFFVSFQGELEKMLDGAKNSEQSIRDVSGIRDTLALLRNTPSANSSIDSSESISLVSLNQSGTIFTESLGWAESREYWITSTGWTTSMALNIVQWGPVSYHLAAFNSGFETNAVLISSGVLTTSGILNLSGSLNTHILIIDPLGGYVQYTLNKKTTTTIPSSSSYRLERDLNGNKENGWVYDITSFVPKSRPAFPYEKMGMYLK